MVPGGAKAGAVAVADPSAPRARALGSIEAPAAAPVAVTMTAADLRRVAERTGRPFEELLEDARAKGIDIPDA